MRPTIRVSFVIVLVTAGLLLAAEVGARAVLWRPLPTVPAANQMEFGFGLGGYGDLAPNLDSIVRLYGIRPYYLHTNSAGLRNMDEVNPDESVFRILVIGDSFAYGAYVHNHEAFPARLEEHLNQRLVARFQVLNAGVPGYTVEDELSYLRDKGLALHPDLVILSFYTNDIFDLYPVIREHFARPVMLRTSQQPASPVETDPLRDFLRQNLALYSLFTSLTNRQETTSEPGVNTLTPTIPGLHRLYQDYTFLDTENPDYQREWQRYEELLRELVALLHSEGIPLVLVAFPDLSQMPLEGGLPDVPQRFLARITSETGTPYLDMLPVFRQAGDIQSLYLMYHNPVAQMDFNAPDAAVMSYTGDGHPSPYGHLVTARVLVDLLIEQGLVPVN